MPAHRQQCPGSSKPSTTALPAGASCPPLLTCLRARRRSRRARAAARTRGPAPAHPPARSSRDRRKTCLAALSPAQLALTPGVALTRPAMARLRKLLHSRHAGRQAPSPALACRSTPITRPPRFSGPSASHATCAEQAQAAPQWQARVYVACSARTTAAGLQAALQTSLPAARLRGGSPGPAPATGRRIQKQSSQVMKNLDGARRPFLDCRAPTAAGPRLEPAEVTSTSAPGPPAG